MIDRPLRPRCRRCLACKPARHLVDGVAVCASCLRELLTMSRDLRIAPLPKRVALSVFVALVLLFGATATALEPSDGAREGESLEQRVVRLRAEIEERRVALRLTLGELAVNRGRR